MNLQHIRFQKIEGLALAALATAQFLSRGFDWYWLIIMFFVYDISMIGYLKSPRYGALTYNVVHSFILPGFILTAAIIIEDNRALFFIGLTWLFHIAVDRFLGYGLKKEAGFRHTHLGKIGAK